MKRKIFLILILFVFAAAGAIFYLNKVILPQKIKSLVISSLHEATQRKVTLNSLQFNIFKGLVLSDLAIYEADKRIIGIKEVSCAFLIAPVFKGKIVLNSIRLDSPVIFFERLPDNTFNLAQLLTLKKVKEGKPRFEVFARKVSVINGRIDFQDDTLSPPFTKSLDYLNAEIYLSLPANIKFNLKSGTASSGLKIEASGNFDLAARKLVSKVAVTNINAVEFLAYYKNTGVSVSEGLADCLADVEFKDNVVLVSSNLKLSNFIIPRDKVTVKANARITSRLKYDLTQKEPSLEGEAQLYGSSVSGLDVVGQVNDITGTLHFNSKTLYSDRISADISGLPLEATVNIADLTRASINVNILNLELASMQKLLKDRMQFTIPADVKGKASIFMALEKTPAQPPMKISGYIDLAGCRVELKKPVYAVEGIAGKIEFNASDFLSPKIKLALSSRDFSLESDLAVKGGIVEVASASGRYLDSVFSLNGRIDTADPRQLDVRAQGELSVDLKDVKEPLKGFQKQLEQIKPEGKVNVKFDINGNINDFKSCVINAQALSPSLSVYGLKATDLFFSFRHKEGILEMPSGRMSLYDGTLEASGAMNLNSDNLPYWISWSMEGVKIEKLKLDTAARKKDISGIIQAQAKLNGFSADLSRLNGQGNINITEGKLWQLDLFKGMGRLIFAQDFSNIVFNEGSCSFIVKDKFIFTDSLRLISNLVEMDGYAKIGFDSSLDSSVRIHVLDEKAPLTSTLKDVATAIIGQSGSFGVIKISGNLQEPKFRFQPAIVDIIKGLKDTVLGNIF